MQNVVQLAVGQPYPLPIGFEGAAAQLMMDSGSIIQIAIPGCLDSEKKLLKKGKMFSGIIVEQPMILLVLKFGDLIFECPFDARIIPAENRRLHDITDDNQRLFVQIHVVDTQVNIIKALRGITFSPKLTLQLFLAIQDQLANYGDFQAVYAKYLNKDLLQLAAMANLSACGE